MAQWVEFETHSDSRGMLNVAERALPFVPRRLFWITHADHQQRGGHGHLVTQLVLVAVTGSITVTVYRSTGREPYLLDSPSRGLHLLPDDWHTMDFGANATLLAIASHAYDADDYVMTPPSLMGAAR